MVNIPLRDEKNKYYSTNGQEMKKNVIRKALAAIFISLYTENVKKARRGGGS